jgi:hypothetical protein
MPIPNVWIVAALLGASVCAPAQWLNYPARGTPRSKDGKPILSAPAPRRDGKPDLSGVWEADRSPQNEIEHLLPEKQNGLGEDFPTKYFLDILSDFKPEATPLLPSVAAALTLSRTTVRKDNPGVHCLPRGSPPMGDTIPEPFKLVQTPDLLVMLIEDGTNFRQIYTDGRKLPDDPTPSWFGYSVGKWEGDTLVVDTIGFNNRGWLDAVGHTRSESMHVTERFHRRDFGHMDLQITLDDPKTFTKPVTVKFSLSLQADGDVLELFCSEDEKDLAHSVNK